MAGGTEFLLQIEQQLKGDNPVTALQKTEQALKAAMGSYKQLEAAATRGGKALDKATANVGAIRAKMQSAMATGDGAGLAKLAGALSKAQAGQAALAASAAKTKAALDAEASSITKLSAALDKLQKEEKDTSTDSAQAVAKTGDGFSKLGGPLGNVGGKVKNLGEAWKDLSANLGSGGAALAVGAVAILAVAAAAIYGAYAIARFALSAANAARDSRLATQAFLAQVGAGKELGDAMTDVEKSTGLAADRQKDIVRSLQAANVDAGQLPAALKAIAVQEAAIGDSSGTQQLIDDLKAGKTTVDELAKSMDSKFGDIAKKRLLGLNQQASTLEKNIAVLFSGVHIDAFLEGLSKIVSIFDADTEAGAALKSLLEAVFQPMGESAKGVFPMVERMLLNVILAALKIGIAVKKAAKEFQFETGPLAKLPGIAEIAASALYATAAAVGLLVAAVAAAVAIYYAFYTAITSVSKAGKAVGEAIVAAWQAAVEFLRGIDLTQIGTDIITGLANGIKAGADKVVGAITGVVGDAVSSAKALLKIGSPSKVFAEIGGFTADGFAGGVEAGADEAQGAMASMVEPPQMPAAGPSSGGPGRVVNIETINIHGVPDAADAMSQLANVLEMHLLQSGGATAEAT